MPGPQTLLRQNQDWSEEKRRDNPQYFERLAGGQQPEYLWIGCADSRVPPNVLLGLEPGEVFVHRNIANIVAHSDLNCLSVLEYAVANLGVKHVIVCGHYGCGGVQAALAENHVGLIDNWLRHIRDVRHQHIQELLAINDASQRLDRLCELNVAAQVAHVCQTTIVQQAWRRRQPLTVHGWIYGLRDGLLKDLKVSASGSQDVAEAYRVLGGGLDDGSSASIPA